MKNRKKLRARRECKRVHHTYAVCTQRKMTKNDEKSICKPTLPTLTIFPPPPPQCHLHMLAVCPQQFEGGKKGPRWAEEQTKPNIIRCHRCRHIVCGCSAPRHTYIYIYIHIFPSVYDSPSLVLLFRLGFDDFPQK